MGIVINGKIPSTFLPDKLGLVLEGGGSRGCYTAGVLDGFLHQDLMFSYIVGVSSGSATVISYLSGQKERNKLIFKHHIPSKKHMGMKHFLCRKSYINRDYVFNQMAQELYFDWNTFRKNKARLIIGAFQCEKGETIWFEKKNLLMKSSHL